MWAGNKKKTRKRHFKDDDDRVIAAEIERDRLAQLARDRAMRAQRQREAHRDRAHFGGFSADSSDRHAEQVRTIGSYGLHTVRI